MNSASLPVDDGSGEMVSIYNHELELLRTVAEYASDVCFGYCNPEFAELNGGSEGLLERLLAIVRHHEQWLAG